MNKETALKLYCELMEEIKRRSDVIRDALVGNVSVPPIVVGELCYLQLRLICELIALGCLVAHGDIEATQTGKMKRAYDADWIVKGLERLHPEFYPQPSRQILGDDGRPNAVEPITSGFLTKDELLRLYGECGGFLHRGTLKSILAEKHARPNFETIRDWLEQIVTLLNHHQIQLIDPKSQVWITMHAVEDGRVHYAGMREIPDVAEFVRARERYIKSEISEETFRAEIRGLLPEFRDEEIDSLVGAASKERSQSIAGEQRRNH